MQMHELGTALVILGFCGWVVAWVGLATYGLVWVHRDHRGASISLFTSTAIFTGGALALAQIPGGVQ